MTRSKKGFVAGGLRATILIGCALALSASAGTLWVAESRGTLKLNALDGAIVLEIPETPWGTGAVGVDPINGNIWTWGDQRLRGFDRDGVNFLDVASGSYPQWEHPNDIVVDGDAGNIWLNLGSNLYRLDLTGQVVGSLLNYGPTCNSLTLDREQSRLWLCANNSVRAFDANFQQVVSLPLSGGVVSRTAWDSYRDELWVAIDDKLRRYDDAGVMTFEMLNPAGTTNTYFLRPDGRGGLWLGSETQFVYIDPTGAVGSWFTPFQDFSVLFIFDAVVHPVDASIWIGNEVHVRRFSTAGVQLQDRFLDLGDGNDRYLVNMDIFEDQSRPVLEFSQPGDNSATNQTQPTLRLVFLDPGSGIDDETLELTLNEAPLAANCTIDALGAECVPNAALVDGPKTVAARISDTVGNESDPATVRFTVDTVAPQISVSSPANGAVTNQSSIIVLGALSEPATLRINGTLVGLDGTNNFSFTASLQEGQNAFAFVATDNATNATTVNRSVTRDTQAPSVPQVGIIGVGAPSAGMVTITGQAGSVEANALVQVTNLRTGLSVTVAATAEGSFVAQIAGEEADQLQIRAIDAAQNLSDPAQTSVPGNLPPNPASVATPLTATGITPFAESVAFLYSGANPIQTGVAGGAIEAERAAVVRGSVTTRTGYPLANVVVSVKGHPEFGETRTRIDGRFDLAVNGGTVLTLDYQRSGYLPLHRYVDTPQRDYVLAGNAVMIQVDPAVSEIALNTMVFQSHQSSVTTDLDGDRRVTLMVPPGTTATMTLPDGSTQPLTTSMRVRATEYTIGVNGIEAMPAPLPPTSAYTYALELSIDEANAAGARRVDFNQPLPVYLENFLNFPIGEEVPIGFYDRGPAAWIPSENGRVVRILAIAGGIADVDVDGSGEAAGPQELMTLGITTAERQRLASLYAVGASFWRFRVTHFSPWDCNFPYDLPSDAVPPPDFDAESMDPDSDESDECQGCTIEAHSQVLGETIPIVGTPYALNYRSDRAAVGTFEFPITGPTIPPSLAIVKVRVAVAGRDIYNTTIGGEYSPPGAAPAPNQTVSVLWDGRDSYGRVVPGIAAATVTVTYGYLPNYSEAPGLLAFGLASRSGATVSQYRGGNASVLVPRLILVERRKVVPMRSRSPAAAHLGGWTMSAHHTLELSAPSAGRSRLVLGDGARRELSNVAPVIQAASSGFTSRIESLTVEFGSTPIMAMSDGTLVLQSVVVAGGGSSPPATDVAATAATFPPLMGVAAVGLDQYFTAGNRVWRRRGNGLLTHIAGTGAAGSSGDDGPATSATLAAPTGILRAPDGALLVAESGGHRIRRIGPDGRITTFAGTGVAGFSGDGGMATSAQLNSPRGLALTASGALLVADEGNRRVRRIDPTGRITTVAGSGSACVDPESLCGDGGAAISASMTSPRHVAVFSNGEIVIADAGTRRVRAVRSDGVMVTIAGNGRAWTTAPEGDAGASVLATLSDEISVATSAGGDTFVGDRNRVRVVRRLGPNQNPTGLSLASEDGRELYQFDVSGLHLRTLDTLTGVEIHRFSYDGGRRLISIRDRSGNLTTIERSPAGAPLAVVAADGQRTALTLDANGFIASVTNPENEVIRMEYSTIGQLTRYTDARNNASTYVYNTAGRLVRDTNAGSGGWVITRTTNQSGGTVSMTSAEGRTSEFTTAMTSVGDRNVATRYPDGTQSTLLLRRNNSSEQQLPDGTQLITLFAPDGRFGAAAPTASSSIVRTPSGLTRSASAARSVTLASMSDPLSVVAATETATLNGRQWVSSFTSANGSRITTTTPEGRTTESTLDSLGRIVEFSTLEIEATRLTYDARGRLGAVESGEGADLRRTTVSYYVNGVAAGLPESITDPEGRVSSFQYDAAGRMTRQTLPGGREVAFAYDENGNLASLTPPGRAAHVFTYSSLDAPASYSPPAAGLPNAATTYAYNLDRQLTSVTRPDGQQIVFGTDSAGRLSTLTTPRGITQFSYAASTGQLQGVTAPEGEALTFAYDGFLPTGVTWSGAVSGGVTLAYDTDFSVSAISVNGRSVPFLYDSDGLVTSAGVLGIGRSLDSGRETGTALGIVTTENAYNAFGELEAFSAARTTSSQSDVADQIRAEIAELGGYINSIWTICQFNFGQSQFGALVTAAEGLPINTESYDTAFAQFRSVYLGSIRPNARFECSSEGDALVTQADASIAQLDVLRDELDEAAEGGSEILLSTQYARDRLGRITQLTEQVLGTEVVYDYSYDAAGRLSQVLTDGAVSESYTYDANGNRLTATGSPATYDDQDRLLTTGNVSFTYTPNGDLLTRVEGGQTTTYSYDALGNLMSAQLPDGRVISYVFDGQNRRVGKRIDGALVQAFLYQDQLRVVAELDASGNVLSRFVYGTKTNVPDYMLRDGFTYRIVSDHLGSPRLVLDAATGNVLQRIGYDSFGRITSDTNPGFQPFGFAGGLSDADTGFVRFGARDYDPQVGRWTTKDAILFDGGDTNLYGYAVHDPINLIDPDGEAPSLPQGFVDAVTGFGDGVFSAVTFGYGDLESIRDAAGIDGGVDECSGAYGGFNTAGRYVGAGAVGGAALKGLAALSKFNALRFLNQNRWLRVGAGKPGPGQAKVPMLRVGPSPWNTRNAAGAYSATKTWLTHWRI